MAASAYTAEQIEDAHARAQARYGTDDINGIYDVRNCKFENCEECNDLVREWLTFEPVAKPTALVEQVIDQINAYTQTAWKDGYNAGYHDGKIDTHIEYETWMRLSVYDKWTLVCVHTDPLWLIQKTGMLSQQFYSGMNVAAEFEIRAVQHGEQLSKISLTDAGYTYSGPEY